nr:phosphate--acyl-ACP acyltransferase [Candidatus Omnitrophota bacterium]
MRIVVDAMGGDHGPGVVVDGVVQAVKEFNREVILVGDEQAIKTNLAKVRYFGDKIAIQHASEV